MVEIDGRSILYTGDFSAENDRHVPPAALPTVSPDILICESTFGTRVHDCRAEREQLFLRSIVNTVLTKQGTVLLPVFAIGRAQELLLILEEHWHKHHSTFEHIPIFYISRLALKAMPAYRCALDNAGRYVRDAAERGQNAYKFRYVEVVESLSEVKHIIDDRSKPCVILCSPGMLQNGTSRLLFEQLSPHPQNSVILTGYSVKGTLADLLRRSPGKVASGDHVFVIRASVEIFSFCAHSDYLQTRAFIKKLGVSRIILVHGERSEGVRLSKKLMEDLGGPQHEALEIYHPEICETVRLSFTPSQTALVLGDGARQLLKFKDLVQREAFDSMLPRGIESFDKTLFAVKDASSHEITLISNEMFGEAGIAVQESKVKKQFVVGCGFPVRDLVQSICGMLAIGQSEPTLLSFSDDGLSGLVSDWLIADRVLFNVVEEKVENHDGGLLIPGYVILLEYSEEPIDKMIASTIVILIEGYHEDHLKDKLSSFKEVRQLPMNATMTDKTDNEIIEQFLRDKFGYVDKKEIDGIKYLSIQVPYFDTTPATNTSTNNNDEAGEGGGPKVVRVGGRRNFVEVLISLESRSVLCEQEDVRIRVLGVLEDYSTITDPLMLV
eukprot:GHVH01001887.1.p1 GENE.GHVH01001887.1~~GHVH01001887.1.p1  ORF type:complete len:610 (-),score=70.57 GHVH01001887.1:444-2273(-)